MAKAMKHERIVPDTSVLIEGLLSKMLKSGTLTTQEILIHEAIVREIQLSQLSHRGQGSQIYDLIASETQVGQPNQRSQGSQIHDLISKETQVGQLSHHG